MTKRDISDFLSAKSKYDILATEIWHLVGKDTNVVQASNCMTRLRLIIKNSEMVDKQKIQELKGVKGVVWNGNELQIIIGGDAYKVKDAFLKVEEKSINDDFNVEIRNKSIKEKIFSFVSGVIIPILPIMITAGLLKAFQTIFEQTGLVEKITISYKVGEISSLITDYDLFSAIVYIISNTGLAFLGLAFIVSTIKYLKGNIMMGLFVGITLVNPYLFGGLSFTLFSIGAVDIKVQSYASSMLPMVCAGFVYVILDKQLKKVVPSTVDIIFRPLLCYVATILISLFLLGPILGIVESGIYYLITAIGNIPYGIGSGLFAFAWQFLVLTGVHTAINGFINMSINNSNPTVLGLCFTLTVLAQMGAGIGMLFRTKNATVKKEIWAAMPATWFGISEPMLYGCTLPKWKPFFWGCVGAGIGGFFIGAVGATSYTVSAGGIFAILRVIEGGSFEISMYVISWFISIFAAAILTALFYKEQYDEKTATIKARKSIFKILKNKNNPISDDLKKTIDGDLKLFLDEYWNEERLQKFKSNYKKIVEEFKINTKIENKTEALSFKKTKLIEKINKKLAKNANYQFAKYNDKFNEIMDDLEKLEKTKATDTTYIQNYLEKSPIKKDQLRFTKSINSIISKIADEEVKQKLCNQFVNAIHSTDINFGYENKIK